MTMLWRSSGNAWLNEWKRPAVGRPLTRVGLPAEAVDAGDELSQGVIVAYPKNRWLLHTFLVELASCLDPCSLSRELLAQVLPLMDQKLAWATVYFRGKQWRKVAPAIQKLVVAQAKRRESLKGKGSGEKAYKPGTCLEACIADRMSSAVAVRDSFWAATG